MRKGQRLLGGIAILAFSFALAAHSAAAFAADFVISNGSVVETVYTVNSMPLSCVDFPAASDSYSWKVRLAKIKGSFIQDLANDIIIPAFNSGTCTSFDDVTNTLAIPPGAPYIKVDSQGLVDVDFDGAIPDFNTINTSNNVNLPFFDYINFQMVYNPKGSAIGGLNPATGTLDMTGNANLCGAITSNQPEQCFILVLQEGNDDSNYSCVCDKSPTVISIDITSLIGP
ncbi:MAG TPA: hypothetical protein VMB26_05020 [Candidatus Binataceae bacterium]|nr:hypothetical protein [Candidatus Binataceae bacterium]